MGRYSGRGDAVRGSCKPTVRPHADRSLPVGGWLPAHTDRGGAELKPLIEEAAAALQLEGDAVEQLGGYLAKAWMDGAMAGQESMLKQAEEAGFTVENRMVAAVAH